MSVRRWSILLAFVIVSLVLSVGVVDWLLARPGIGIGRGLPLVFQFLEPVVAYGLLRLRGWAHSWGLVWFALKAVCALSLSAFVWTTGIRTVEPTVSVAVGLFYLAFALFLYFSDEFFD